MTDKSTPIQIPGFEILTELSSGGMGDVVLARKVGVHGFQKLLAIKTIRGELARKSEIRAMFLDEAKLVARLDHSAIAQVYDFGETGGTLFLAMEYVPGIAVNRLMAKLSAPLEPLIAARIIAKVCRGLHAAHELKGSDGDYLGVVHRDVTPGNLMMAFNGHVKILDFGIAFMADRESPDTQQGELKGKPSYMAPEQLRGSPVDRRSDVYATSVVFHELLTGQKLFTRHNVVATVMAVERDEVLPPSQIVANVPPELDEIVLKGVSRTPEERYETARQMAIAIDQVLAKYGGENLEAFVERSLQEDRKAHDAWLRSVLSQAGASTTLPSQTGNLGQAALATLAGVSDPELEVPRKNNKAIALVLLLLVVVAAAFFVVRDQKKPKAVAIEPIEAPSPTAPAIEPPKPKSPEPEKEAVVAKEPPPEPKPKARRRRTAKKVVPKQAPPPTPPKTPAIEPPKPEGFGFLTVGARPYAIVRVDGRNIGPTPILRRRIPAGKHTVELVRPNDSTVRYRQKIDLTKDGHQRIRAPAE